MRTRHLPLFIAALTAWVVCPGAGSRAQGTLPDRQDRPASAISARPNVVRIDAIVTDSRGRPALDLKPEDFEVRDDGVLQTIDSAELEMAGRAAASGAELPPILSALDEQREARRAGTRLLAFFLDEYHVSAGANATGVRDALLRFVDEQIRPDDLVVVMKPLDSLTSIRLTRDREAIRAAVRTFVGRKADYAPRTPFEQDYMSRAPASLEAVRGQVVLSALNALAAHLGGLREGRKALVFISEALGGDASSGGARLPAVRTIVRTANRFNVAIYAVDPRSNGSIPATGERSSPEFAPGHDGTIADLRALAEQTDGEAIVNMDDLDPGLRRIARDLDAYYLLTYRSSHANDGQRHAVEVRVKRRDAQVRARPGYWAPVADEASLPPSQPPVSPMRVRPLSQSPLIRPWFGMTRGPGGRTRVTFTWEPTGRKGGGRQRIDPDTVVLSATAVDGTLLFRGPVASVYAGASDGAKPPERAVFDAPPGRIDLDMTIQAADDSVIDSDAREVEVLDLSGARTAMGTPEVLRTRTAREFLAVSADPDAPPVVSREFSRAERLLIRVPAYGPGPVAPIVTARLLNSLGQPLHDVAAMPVPARDGVTQFDLPLAAFAIGEYSLELTATSAAGRVAEFIAFRVTS